jgi:hypothetical protein
MRTMAAAHSSITSLSSSSSMMTSAAPLALLGLERRLRDLTWWWASPNNKKEQIAQVIRCCDVNHLAQTLWRQSRTTTTITFESVIGVNMRRRDGHCTSTPDESLCFVALGRAFFGWCADKKELGIERVCYHVCAKSDIILSGKVQRTCCVTRSFDFLCIFCCFSYFLGGIDGLRHFTGKLSLILGRASIKNMEQADSWISCTTSGGIQFSLDRFFRNKLRALNPD